MVVRRLVFHIASLSFGFGEVSREIFYIYMFGSNQPGINDWQISEFLKNILVYFPLVSLVVAEHLLILDKPTAENFLVYFG